MIGKSFEKVLYVVCIGVLHHLAVLGCQRNRDCHTQTEPHVRRKCCHKMFPPRCMNKVLCHYYGNNNTKLATTYPKFTDPDYDKFNFPDFNEFTVPNIDEPTFSYNDYDSTDNSSRWTGGASAGMVFLVSSIFIIGCRLLQNRPSRNHFRQNCNVQPPSAMNTSRTNLAAQQNEEPSRMVILAMTREEDHISRENRPPDDEPPFLSEENILHNLHNNCAQEPPPYEETTAEPLLSNYEDYVHAAMDQPPSPVYPEVHTTSRSPINPSQITPPIQQNLPITNVNPPSYEEAQSADNQAIEPLP